jgi:hypothetical protein
MPGYRFQVTEQLSERCQRPDAIVVMGVGVMDTAFEAIERWPAVPLFVYHWDCYSWVWDNPRPHEYDYNRWGQLLRQAREIWVPSHAEQERTRDWWDLHSEVILSSIPYWEHNNVRDDGYALCTLRRLPDPWCDEFAKACSELGIPYNRPNHKLTYDAYQDLVAGCRFMVSHYDEASTGGLSLLEGYYHGKPCLITSSVRNGVRDYIGGGRSWEFQCGDHRHFRDLLQKMYEAPLIVADDHRQWVQRQFSDRRMMREMLERIRCAHFTRAARPAEPARAG